MSMFELEMLPAAEGDALLITYGDSDNLSRILIDGGRRSTYHLLRERILAIPLNSEGKRFFKLLIVTHIDADHIEGIICLLQDDELNCEFGDIWFNDWNHLEPLRIGEPIVSLGAAQGEFLGALLADRDLPWNKAFGGNAVVIPPDPDSLPVVDLKDGVQLTLVSPTIDALIELREEWTDAIEGAGFTPGNRDEALQQFADKAWSRLPTSVLGDEDDRRTLDHSEANGSSIAVILEYADIRLLLSGDAWPHILRPALERWCDEKEEAPERVELTAFKIPHHGSKKNVTPQLMEIIDCPTYMISTSGARFDHPDVEAIQILIDGHAGGNKPELLFNYRSEDNQFWENSDRCKAMYEQDAVLAFEIS
jgi:hypothetical protein